MQDSSIKCNCDNCRKYLEKQLDCKCKFCKYKNNNNITKECKILMFLKSELSNLKFIDNLLLDKWERYNLEIDYIPKDRYKMI
jgi:hypothetical protein